MGFWHRYYRSDLKGFKNTRIANPATGHTPQKDIFFLTAEEEAALSLDKDQMYYFEPDPGSIAPMQFTTNIATSHADVYLGNGETFGPLTVAVSGGLPPYSYQWKRGSSNVGSNSPTFGPSNVDDVFPSNGAYNWSCVVTDAAGSTITSNIMPVTSYRLPSFTTQPPATLSVATGAAISIPTTPATTSKAPRTYQWYKGGVAISGATAANFTKSAAVAGDAGTYYVIVTDANGKTAQSTNCVLTVTA